VTQKENVDVLILGSGIIGLSIGIALLESSPKLKIIIAEKEEFLALHASGRNSGVLHAGFYYSPDSFKARFCAEGNRELQLLARTNSIPLRNVGKVIVTRNMDENQRLIALFERGLKNSIELEMHDVSKLSKFEPLAKSYQSFMWSPTTSISSPKFILQVLSEKFVKAGGQIHFKKNLSLHRSKGELYESSNQYNARFIVNAAGGNAEKIAHSVGVGKEYTMLPFLGTYRATSLKNLPLKTLVYPVPHPINPFLGIHFTITVDNQVKVGPTAFPVIGSEQYKLFAGWKKGELVHSSRALISLLRGGNHDIIDIVKHEWPKLFTKSLVKESQNLVPSANQVQTWEKKPSGIRAQLVHTQTGKLEQDFILKMEDNSCHILNAVSPGWTSALPFGRYIAERIVNIF
jgi:L-2-hydroxyglutarate oxidase LhgO